MGILKIKGWEPSVKTCQGWLRLHVAALDSYVAYADDAVQDKGLARLSLKPLCGDMSRLDTAYADGAGS